MVKQYQNKEWLEKKYLEEKLSQTQIAILCKVSHSTIYRWLKKYYIFCRSNAESVHLSKANHCNLSKKAIEWIDGELLGDGHLSPSSIYSASFAYGSKYFEYIKYISNTLNSFGIKQLGNIHKIINKNRGNVSYHCNSSYYVELLSIRKKWYPKGKKRVPRNIKLTPLTCRQWYIGDGNIMRGKRGRPRITLATYGFSIFDVKLLVEKLKNLGFKATRREYNNTIGISSYSTKQFINYIGKCPAKCYQYKFNYEMS